MQVKVTLYPTTSFDFIAFMLLLAADCAVYIVHIVYDYWLALGFLVLTFGFLGEWPLHLHKYPGKMLWTNIGCSYQGLSFFMIFIAWQKLHLGLRVRSVFHGMMAIGGILIKFKLTVTCGKAHKTTSESFFLFFRCIGWGRYLTGKQLLLACPHSCFLLLIVCLIQILHLLFSFWAVGQWWLRRWWLLLRPQPWFLHHNYGLPSWDFSVALGFERGCWTSSIIGSAQHCHQLHFHLLLLLQLNLCQ